MLQLKRPCQVWIFLYFICYRSCWARINRSKKCLNWAAQNEYFWKAHNTWIWECVNGSTSGISKCVNWFVRRSSLWSHWLILRSKFYQLMKPRSLFYENISKLDRVPLSFSYQSTRITYLCATAFPCTKLAGLICIDLFFGVTETYKTNLPPFTGRKLGQFTMMSKPFLVIIKLGC